MEGIQNRIWGNLVSCSNIYFQRSNYRIIPGDNRHSKAAIIVILSNGYGATTLQSNTVIELNGTYFGKN